MPASWLPTVSWSCHLPAAQIRRSRVATNKQSIVSRHETQYVRHGGPGQAASRHVHVTPRTECRGRANFWSTSSIVARVVKVTQNPLGSRPGRRGQQLASLIIRVAILKNFGVLALALGGALVALWRRRRAPAAEKLAYTRRFVSRRIADRDARDEQALVRWDDESAANQGGSNAAIR